MQLSHQMYPHYVALANRAQLEMHLTCRTFLLSQNRAVALKARQLLTTWLSTPTERVLVQQTTQLKPMQ